jgi:hypothetical protein
MNDLIRFTTEDARSQIKLRAKDERLKNPITSYVCATPHGASAVIHDRQEQRSESDARSRL